MKKTFNYTGRKRLYHKGSKPDFKIKLTEETDFTSSFTIELVNFEKFKNFGSDSIITVDCFDPNYHEHFNFGAIKDLTKDLNTKEVPVETDSLKFDLKVINKEKEIIAMAKNIIPATTFSLFAVRSMEMDDIWKTSEFYDDERPIIYCNKDLKIKKKLIKRDPKYLLMILPAAFREFLQKFLMTGQVKNEDTWATNWMRFACKIVGDENHPKEYINRDGDNDTQEWIEKFSTEYSRILEEKHGIKTKYLEEEKN